MTSFAQVTALVDAHVRRDHDRFRAVTLQIAAHQSERNADHLRKLVDKPQASSFVPLPSASGLISAREDLASIDDMVLATSVRERLDRVLLEHDRRIDLLAIGLHPVRKLLFTGPPGVGKSMSAGAIARAVQMPLFRVELHGVISQYLGETAGKLAKVFDHIRTMPGVYLFDEFDALGTERGTRDDSASSEMRRVVNSLLQFIEDDRSDSLIVAATNHDRVLDPALFRRFDETIVFDLPSKDEVIELVRRSLGINALDVDATYAAVSTAKIGHMDVCAAMERVRKDHLLVHAPIDTASVVMAIAQRGRRVLAEGFS